MVCGKVLIMKDDFHITGTYLWYYTICKREVWLLSHQIQADQQDENMDIGRFIHETSYSRDKKEIKIGAGNIDFIRKRNGQYVVSEIKKSSKFLESAKMQLLYYLYDLEKDGLKAKGEIRIPEEKKVFTIELNKENIKKIEEACTEILKIINMDKPLLPKKIKYCGKCAYQELCWS